MASEVEICNLALARLGDAATVVSIDPPEGSAQAEHCAMFYPMARDTLLAQHPWGFAQRRVRPARLAAGYLLPDDCLCVNDTGRAKGWHVENSDGHVLLAADFEIQEIRYTARIKDATRFPPLFVSALGWQLASMMAGAVLKGEAGIQMGAVCAQQAAQVLAQAKNADGEQYAERPRHVAPWIRARGQGWPISGC